MSVRAVTGILLAAAGAAVAGCSAPQQPRFEIEFSSSAPGRAQLFYMVGRDTNEEDSVSRDVRPGAARTTLSFPLPWDRIREFRFDPRDGSAEMSFANARVIGPAGKVVRTFRPEDFKPNDQVGPVAIAGSVASFHPQADVNDPYFMIGLDAPLDLRPTQFSLMAGHNFEITSTIVVLLAVIAAGATCGRSWPRLKAALESGPKRGLLLVGLGAAVLASYPVVFFGKSFVSANIGAALLFESPPTVPGSSDTRWTDAYQRDIGAMMWQHLPYSTVQARAILDAGTLPLWNRYNSAGVTLLGQGQSMLGDPIHLLVILARGAPWAWDLKFILAKALFASGLAITVWLLTRDAAAAVLVAAAAAFIGFFNYRYNHPAIFSVAYSPWVACAWAGISAAADRAALRRWLWTWCAANFVLLASGTVKEAYLLCMALNVFGGLLWLLRAPPAGVARWRRAPVIAAAGIATLLVSAPLWLNFLDALQSSHTAYDQPQVFQAPRAWFIGLFDDLFYREIQEPHLYYVPSGNFLVLLGVGLALAAPRRLWSERWPLAALAAIAGAVALAFEFVPRDWILALPFFRNVYFYNNILSAVALGPLLILAGWGFHSARPALAEGRVGRLLAVALGGPLVLMAIYFHDLPGRWLAGGRLAGGHGVFFWSVGLMLGAMAVLILLAGRRLRGRRAGLPAAALATLCLAVLCFRDGMHLNTGALSGYLTMPMARIDLYHNSTAVDFMKHDSPEPFRVVGLRNDLFPGFLSTYGLEGINGPDAIMNREYRELAEAAGFTDGGDWRFFIDPGQLAPRIPLLNLLGVKYIAGRQPELAAETGLTKAAALDLDVFRNEGAWPRAFFTPSLEIHRSLPAFLLQLRARRAQPFASADSETAGLPGLPRTPGAAVGARNYSLEPNRTSFTIDAPAAGVAVLTETWLPADFRATLNGEPVPYFRVNHAFKAIAIPGPGTYRVAFEYHPRLLTLSLGLALFGLIGLVVLTAYPLPLRK